MPSHEADSSRSPRPPHRPVKLIGVDAGGTRTRLVLTSHDLALIGRGEGGPGNLRDVGPDGLAKALREARDSAGISGPADALVLGVAGAATEEDRALAAEVAGALDLAPRARVQALSDLHIAQAGAFEGGPGVVVVAGTGSAVYGRDADGNSGRRGGLGGTLNDAGSAADLARRALAEGLLDGGAAGLSRRALAARAIEVLADPRARDLVDEAVGALADAACQVMEELNFDEVCVVGGMSRSELWSEAFRAALTQRRPQARPIPPRLEPVLGAALLARDLQEFVV